MGPAVAFIQRWQCLIKYELDISFIILKTDYLTFLFIYNSDLSIFLHENILKRSEFNVLNL